MESIFALSPISFRIGRSSFTSISTLANHRNVSLRAGNASQVTKLSPVIDLHFEMGRCNRFTKEFIMSCFVTSGSDFRVHRDCSVAVLQAVRLQNSARYSKNQTLNSKQNVFRSPTKPPLIRPLHDHSKSGKWAQEAVNTACKDLITPEKSDSKKSGEYEDEFAGYDYEIDCDGNVVPRFLVPPDPSRYDVYKRWRFNEDLIFEFDG